MKNKIIPTSQQRSERPRSAFQRSNGPSRPPATPCADCSQGVGNNGHEISSDKDNDRVDKENDFSDGKINEENETNIGGTTTDDEEVNIDDGLLTC